MQNCFVSVVPPPHLQLAVTPSTVPLYEQTVLNLTCLATLDDSVDTSVAVVSTWTGPNRQLLSSTPHISVSSAARVGERIYVSTVKILSTEEEDSGVYQCNISVSSTNQTILTVSEISSVTINVTGI